MTQRYDSQPHSQNPKESIALFSTQTSKFMPHRPDSAATYYHHPVQSASIWRHTSLSYSFSKDQRFKPQALDTSMVEINLPSTKGKKSCSFGKGKRHGINPNTIRASKQVPDPGTYNIRTKPGQSAHSKSFGVGFYAYEKVHNPIKKQNYAPHMTQGNPPAHYDVREKVGKHKRKTSIFGRLKMYSQHMADIKKWVPDAHYQVRDKMFERQVSFGVGQRIDLAKPANNNPGPIYNPK